MSPRPPRLQSAFWLIGIGLLLTGGGWLMLRLFAIPDPVPPPAGEVVTAEQRGRLRALSSALFYTFLLFWLFLIGALLIRAGRRVVRAEPESAPAPYVDAWSAYRLDDKAIAEATDAMEDEHADTEDPDDDQRRADD